jgi:hypothetical protein
MNDTHAGQFDIQKPKHWSFMSSLKEMCIVSTVEVCLACKFAMSICAALI